MPGSGKTTLLGELERRCNSRDWEVVRCDAPEVSVRIEGVRREESNLPVVLLVDETEKVVSEKYRAVITGLKNLAAKRERVMAVLAGRNEMVFYTDPSLSREGRLESWRLRGLSGDDLAAAGINKETAGKIIEITGGYPPAVVKVRQILEQNPSASEGNLVEAAYEAIKKYALKGMSEEDKDLIKQLANLDGFDSSAVASLMKSNGNAAAEFLYRNRHLLVWGELGFRVDPSIAATLKRYSLGDYPFSS